MLSEQVVVGVSQRSVALSNIYLQRKEHVVHALAKSFKGIRRHAVSIA